MPSSIDLSPAKSPGDGYNFYGPHSPDPHGLPLADEIDTAFMASELASGGVTRNRQVFINPGNTQAGTSQVTTNDVGNSNPVQTQHARRTPTLGHTTMNSSSVIAHSQHEPEQLSVDTGTTAIDSVSNSVANAIEQGRLSPPNIHDDFKVPGGQPLTNPNRNTNHPFMYLVQNHPLVDEDHPHITHILVYVQDVRLKARRKQLEFENSLKIPLGPDESVCNDGFYQIPPGTIIFARRRGEHDPNNDRVMAWNSRLDLLEDEALFQQVDRVRAGVLGDIDKMTLERPGDDAETGGTHFERLGQKGIQDARCFSAGLTWQRQRKFVSPSAGGKLQNNRLADWTPNVKLRSEIVHAGASVAMKSMETFAPNYLKNGLKHNAEANNVPSIGVEGNYACPAVQVNIAPAVSMGESASKGLFDMGDFGSEEGHRDRGDSPAGMTTMISCSRLPHGYQPGRFYLTFLGVVYLLEPNAITSFNGLQKHGGTPPIAPKDAQVEPWAYRLAFVMYPPTSMLSGAGVNTIPLSSWPNGELFTIGPEVTSSFFIQDQTHIPTCGEATYAFDGAPLMPRNAHMRFMIESLLRAIRALVRPLPPDYNVTIDEASFYQAFKFVDASGQPQSLAPPQRHNSHAQRLEFEHLMESTSQFIPWMSTRNIRDWCQDISDLDIQRPVERVKASAKRSSKSKRRSKGKSQSKGEQSSEDGHSSDEARGGTPMTGSKRRVQSAQTTRAPKRARLAVHETSSPSTDEDANDYNIEFKKKLDTLDRVRNDEISSEVYFCQVDETLNNSTDADEATAGSPPDWFDYDRYRKDKEPITDEDKRTLFQSGPESLGSSPPQCNISQLVAFDDPPEQGDGDLNDDGQMEETNKVDQKPTFKWEERLELNVQKFLGKLDVAAVSSTLCDYDEAISLCQESPGVIKEYAASSAAVSLDMQPLISQLVNAPCSLHTAYYIPQWWKGLERSIQLSRLDEVIHTTLRAKFMCLAIHIHEWLVSIIESALDNSTHSSSAPWIHRLVHHLHCVFLKSGYASGKKIQLHSSTYLPGLARDMVYEFFLPAKTLQPRTHIFKHAALAVRGWLGFSQRIESLSVAAIIGSLMHFHSDAILTLNPVWELYSTDGNKLFLGLRREQRDRCSCQQTLLHILNAQIRTHPVANPQSQLSIIINHLDTSVSGFNRLLREVPEIPSLPPTFYVPVAIPKSPGVQKFLNFLQHLLPLLQAPQTPPTTPLLLRVQSDLDFFLPFRQLAPTILRARQTIYADGERLKSSAGLFNIILFRGFCYGSPWALNHLQWFEDYEEWHNCFETHPNPGSANRELYFICPNAYGTCAAARHSSNIVINWERIQRVDWSGFLQSQWVDPNFDYQIDFFKQFHAVGDLTAMLIVGDLVKCGLLPMPPTETFGITVAGVDKGAVSGLRLLDLVTADSGIAEVSVAFSDLHQVVLQHFDQATRDLMDYDILTLEHSLCKFSRLKPTVGVD